MKKDPFIGRTFRTVLRPQGFDGLTKERAFRIKQADLGFYFGEVTDEPDIPKKRRIVMLPIDVFKVKWERGEIQEIYNTQTKREESK